MAISTQIRRRSAAELAADGFAAIVEKLGMAEAVRYVQLYHQGAGDYTRQRRQWLDDLSHEEVAKRMAEADKKRPRKRKGAKTPKAARSKGA